MKASELIAKLLEFDEDLEVMIRIPEIMFAEDDGYAEYDTDIAYVTKDTDKEGKRIIRLN